MGARRRASPADRVRRAARTKGSVGPRAPSLLGSLWPVLARPDRIHRTLADRRCENRERDSSRAEKGPGNHRDDQIPAAVAFSIELVPRVLALGELVEEHGLR